jgi:hypothetical protein
MAPSRLRPFFLLCVFLPLLAFLAWADYDALQSARLGGNPAPFVPLGLASDRSGADWKLTWNPSAVPFAHAASAELRIEDGNHETQILLSPAQIRSGSIVYSPFTADISFRLRAYDGERLSVPETLRVLDSQPLFEAANTPQSGYAERSSLRRPRTAVTRTAPGSVIVQAATLRGASPGAPTSQRTRWPYRLWRSESKLEITETVH